MKFRNSQRGVALVLTLIMLAIITIVVVVFLATSRRNRQTTTLRRDQTDSELAVEAAFQHAGAEIMTNILGRTIPIRGNPVPDPNLLAFDFFVSAPLGYDVYATNWALGSTNTRPFLSDEIPVVVNRSGSVDVYLDLNRDDEFNDPRGVDTPYGDPIWIGVRDKSWLPHAANNKFVSRYAYVVLPVGKSLDLNTIHNAASSTTGYDFKRNQGFGPWEMNLAAFLAELNPDVWWEAPNGNIPQYTYGPFPAPVAGGDAFIDARSIVEYRHAWGRGPKYSIQDVYPRAAGGQFPPFPPPSLDVFADGDAPSGGTVLGTNVFAPDDDFPAKLSGSFGWSGADSTNHWFHPQELFDATNKVTARFATNLNRAIRGDTRENIRARPSAFYKLISQLSTEAGSDYHDRINLNYAALGTNSADEFIPWDASPALATIFFTNVAERIFRAQSNEFNNLSTNQLPIRSITQIPVFPTNLYSAAIHRIMQQAANIFDATRSNIYPSVFRPVFGSGEIPGANYIVGWVNDDRVSTLPSWLSANTNGIPLVIGAKKGFPNFNEFTLRSDFLVSRKVELHRPTVTSRPDATNQMYVLGISNYFGLEAWNPYEVTRRGAYPRPVQIYVTNDATMTLYNDLGVQIPPTTISLGSFTNVPANAWRGGETLGFLLPFNTNAPFLSNSVYRFPPQNDFVRIAENAFERGVSGFPMPYWVFTISNRLSYLMHEGDRIVDFVLLQEVHSVDLFRDLVASINPYQNAGAVSATIGGVWNTNRVGSATSPTLGLVRQLEIALGNSATSAAEWRQFGLAATPSENSKAAAIDAFRRFCGFGPLTTNYIGTNDTLYMQAPFNPAAKLAVLSTWQANDPLVHYHSSDLRMYGASTNHQYLKPSQPATNVSPASLGRLNDRYSPWGGRPNSSYLGPDQYSLALKDPGIASADDWEFPTNKLASIGLLGRIHRGTPWQTVYFKAEAAPIGGPLGWTNQSPDMAARPNGDIFSRTHATNDWKLADMFTTAIDERTSRGLMSINQTNMESWSALFGGVVVLSNSLETPSLAQGRQYTEMFIEPWGSRDFVQSQFAMIWSNIYWLQRFPTNLPPRPLQSVGDLLQVPQLTTESPFLNQQGDQRKWGLDDFAYERIPQQILSLLRVGQSRFVIYAYGQALKPADINPADGVVRNYQVTAEYATRTVLRAEGDPRSRVRLVVESFNVLPPD